MFHHRGVFHGGRMFHNGGVLHHCRVLHRCVLHSVWHSSWCSSKSRGYACDYYQGDNRADSYYLHEILPFGAQWS